MTVVVDDAEIRVVLQHLGQEQILAKVVQSVRRALDEIIATGRTRRWNLDQCNDQEKAYVGVNLENILRGELDLAPHRPRRPDFDILGVEVDCKWSRKWNGWQIPREAVGEICLLVYGDDLEDEIAVGLIRIDEEFLVGGNQDKKRSIQSPEGISRASWLVPRGRGLPENFLMSLRKDDRDAILRPRGGDERALELFRRCEGLVIERHTIEAIGQQVDSSRRFRGETIGRLAADGLELVNGTWLEKRQRSLELGGPTIKPGQWIALRSDGSTPGRLAESEPRRIAEAKAYRLTMKKELAEQRDTAKKLRAAEKALLESLEEAAAEADIAASEAVGRAEVAAAATAEQLQLGTS